MNSALCALVLGGILALDARAQSIELKNPGFESVRDSTAPRTPGWIAGPGASVVSSKARNGVRSLQIAPAGADTIISVVQTFRVDAKVGQIVELSGDIETDKVSGWAALWIRVDGNARTLAVDNMEKSGPRGTARWKRYAVQVPIPPGAERIIVGALHVGTGVSWFDNINLKFCSSARTC